MITTIRIKNVATFNEQGIEINDLKPVNFIYGANASGKTTISNFISNQEESGFSNCGIIWENNRPLKTLVYNKQFRERNFRSGKIRGVFTLGQASNDEIDAIEKKKDELKANEEETKKKRNSKSALENEQHKLEEKFRESAWNSVYKIYEQQFSEAFTGFKGSKEKFAKKLIESLQQNSIISITLDELKRRAAVLFGEVPQEYAELTIFDVSGIADLLEDAIWNKKIIGKGDVPIAQLIQRLNMNDWVREGQQYIQDSSEICPFCQKKTISEDFRKQLDEFFDENYTNDIATLKEKSNQYNTLMENIA